MFIIEDPRPLEIKWRRSLISNIGPQLCCHSVPYAQIYIRGQCSKPHTPTNNSIQVSCESFDFVPCSLSKGGWMISDDGWMKRWSKFLNGCNSLFFKSWTLTFSFNRVKMGCSRSGGDIASCTHLFPSSRQTTDALGRSRYPSKRGSPSPTHL